MGAVGIDPGLARPRGRRRLRRVAAASRRSRAGLRLRAIWILGRAIEAARKAGDSGPLVQGVTMVVTQFLETLKRFGVTRMDAEGQPFDPSWHEAIAQVPTADNPPHTVLTVFGSGYLFHDRVLRPAQVAVSAAPPPDTQPE